MNYLQSTKQNLGFPNSDICFTLLDKEFVVTWSVQKIFAFFFSWDIYFTLIELGAYLMLYGLSWIVLTLAYVLWLLGVVHGSS